MKKFWLGCCILSGLLLLGILSGARMHKVHGQLFQDLSRAAMTAQTDWEKANALASNARAKWEKHRHLASALADHEPLEQMDSLFLELDVYRHPGQWEQYAAACTQLASLSQRVGEEQVPFWWNLL